MVSKAQERRFTRAKGWKHTLEELELKFSFCLVDGRIDLNAAEDFFSMLRDNGMSPFDFEVAIWMKSGAPKRLKKEGAVK